MLIFSCDGEQPGFQEEVDVVVDFDYEISGDCSTPVLEIILENKTAKAESYMWDFGDGTTSNQVNPKKVYAKSGEYLIKLTAYFSGDTAQIEKQIGIIRNSDGTGPIGQLSFTRSNATDLEITFNILTDEPSYSLSFGDGSATLLSNEKVIKHHYSGGGTYSALLIVQNTEGCNCVDVTLNLTP
jgi:PKD repeat protein